MGQFLVQVKGSLIVVTFPYTSSLERGATMPGTEEWLMALPPASFNQFASGSMQAVRLVENSVVWIPYGWVTITVNCARQVEFPHTLVIPYLNAKLALGYPPIGLLVTFHLEHVKANQGKGAKYWTDHGDSYIEWLGTLNLLEDSQIDLEGIQTSPPGQAALMDGPAEDADMEHEETEDGAEGESQI